MNYLLPTNELGRTQLALGGTQNANQEWRAASFVKTYNALKVIVVEEDKSVCRSLMVNIVLLKLNDTHILRGIFWHKKGGFSGCANDSNCPGFDSVCDPIDHSNCSFCDNNNCTGGKPDHQKTTTITITTPGCISNVNCPPLYPVCGGGGSANTCGCILTSDCPGHDQVLTRKMILDGVETVLQV